jgi:hypothetical protein
MPNPSAWYVSFTWETFLFNLLGVLGPYLIGLLGSVTIYALWSIGWAAMVPVMWVVNFGLFWYIQRRFLHKGLSPVILCGFAPIGTGPKNTTCCATSIIPRSASLLRSTNYR